MTFRDVSTFWDLSTFWVVHLYLSPLESFTFWDLSPFASFTFWIFHLLGSFTCQAPPRTRPNRCRSSCRQSACLNAAAEHPRSTHSREKSVKETPSLVSCHCEQTSDVSVWMMLFRSWEECDSCVQCYFLGGELHDCSFDINNPISWVQRYFLGPLLSLVVNLFLVIFMASTMIHGAHFATSSTRRHPFGKFHGSEIFATDHYRPSL